ncbi:MAG: phage portal protein [bacterium]|nr:phage portal protein [bacterium]
MVAKPKLTRLDRFLSRWAPSVGLRRVRARLRIQAGELALRKFDGASRRDRLRNWISSGTSANAEIGGAAATLRARMRDLVRNNPWARRAVEVIEANVVGTGIVTQVQAEQDDPQLVARALEVEAAWRTWAGSPECDADGCHDMHALQSLVMRTLVESGEVLIRRRRRRAGDGLSVPLQLQVLEPDYLDTTRDRLPDEHGRRIEQGIELDAIGRRRGYWLYREHPGEVRTLRNFESVFVPASEVLHIYRVERPGQLRGVPWGHAVMISLHDLGDFEDGQLHRQKLAACYMGFVHDLQGGDVEPEALAEDFGGDLEPGTWKGLPAGKTVTWASPPQVGGFSEYVSQVLHAIAAAFGISYEALTGDLRGVNFSSGRMGWLEMQRNLRRWQSNLMIARFLRPVFGWFLEAAELVGVPVEGVTASWTPPRREMIDPTKEVPATVAAIRGGLTTLSDAIRTNGGDPAAVYDEWERDAATWDEKELVFDCDARRTSGSTANSEKSADDENGEGDESDEEGEEGATDS